MKCPTCRHAVTKDGNKLFPFCSERCQLVDLGRWINEDYRVPAEEPDAKAGPADGLPGSDD